jgi:hypothetical protein
MIEHYSGFLRATAASVGVEPVQQLALGPGVSAVYRVIVHNGSSSACDVVATLTRAHTAGAQLEVIYRGRFQHKPITRAVTEPVYDAWCRALHTAGLDRLDDQVDSGAYGVDLCMIERGAGSYTRSVIFSPRGASGPYRVLVDALRTHLPEVMREVRR